MAFLNSIKGLLGLGPKPAAAKPADTRPTWQIQGFDNEDQWKLDNGIVTSTGQYDNPQFGRNPIPEGYAPPAVIADNAAKIASTKDPLTGRIPNQVQAPQPVSTAPAAPVLPDRSNSIRSNEAALAATDSQRSGGLSAIQSSLDKLFGRYNQEADANSASYNQAADNNKGNLQRNTQAALVNAAQGRRGLFGVLSSLGALSGSGIQLANRAVQQGANADITGANETFGENQGALDTSIAQFKTADQKRREDAQAAAENSRLSLENQIFGNKQKIYSNLADDYSQMGNAGEARRYADMVAALFPEIARTSVPAAEIGYSGAQFSAPTLSKYVGGDAATTVRATPAEGSSPLPGLVAINPLRKRLQD